ncbi:membrane protein UL45 [Canid alphaherpesvirus 1]|uniref:Membrane protein UL45 n=1 Tax=Canid alphaherpesvirus 1 TaxID=170325 RepID=Q66077_9ALPH|nr:membrane protein UL45 [Canid alphaherpesvirus 1]ALL25891.1 membrane protein UL45 [Canid alphaherpesvirus 1]ALL25971.1 membrane protein UL45 [Canid alphaherpesvirus 1]ALL26047.1 membrane protein UL45 [Canid alphaherpesvirus 1]ARE29819.1 membrane protein UL45 [Canid alphaherpesvirus 1]QQL08478.1 membrane protein UL45 [Canid alphaherpesvirus 1]
MAQLVLTDIPLEDVENKNTSSDEETTNLNQKKSTCQCLCVTLGFFAAGILLTIAAIIFTFIFTVPLEMLGSINCPPSTFGIDNVCIEPIKKSINSYSELSKICYDRLSNPINQSTINSLLTVLNMFADKNYENVYNCNTMSEKTCNSSIAICQTNHPLSSLGNFVIKIRKIFGFK